MTAAEHAKTCRQILRREDVPRLADCPYLRLTCVHGYSWHVTEDGAPLPALDQRGWRATPTAAPGCRYCGTRPLPRGRKFCPPPRDCYRLWAREISRKRGAQEGAYQ